jgi:CheY-like chemotaxis protein
MSSTPPARILLAEDDRFLRRAAESTLRKHGFVVVTAVDGEQALRLARSGASSWSGATRPRSGPRPSATG